MTLKLAELRKIYAQNQYSPTDFFLNPFTEPLFLNNWLWPQDCFSSRRLSGKKAHSGSDNLKQKIKEWFKALDFQSKQISLMVKDRQFIETLCYFLQSYSSRNVYNMKKRKYIKSIEMSDRNLFVEEGLNLVLENLEVAFLQEPVLHVSKNGQNFFSNQLIKWMEVISQHKLFQFANKFNDSQKGQENVLWFCSGSFHKLQCFIVNEFQKAITRSYFNRDKITSNYLINIKQFCKNQKDQFKYKNIESELLGLSLRKTAQLSLKQINSKFNQMKEIEISCEKEKQKLIQKLLHDQIQGSETNNSKKKKKRIRKKFKVEEQIENKNQKEQHKKKQSKKTVCKATSPQKLIKAKTFMIQEEMIQDQEKVELVFNDQISQISKCEDSQFHDTDVTFQKYFENEDKISGPENSPPSIVKKCQENSIEKETKMLNSQTLVKDQNNQSEKDQQQIQGTNENQPSSSDQSIRKSSFTMKQKKKSKKQKLIEGLQDNLIKSIRNSAFTEFIDSISIESNNLYNYKLSAYQFIVFFISSLLPTTNITLFGSNAVGLSLASSDIDIMISNLRWSTISEIREVLYHIGSEISKMGWVVDYRLILNAKVPVLKLFIDPKIDYFGHSPLKYASQMNLMESIVIKADIIVNIEGQQNIGCDSTMLMKELLTDHPQLQRIILFFKYVLWYYGLNENYRGGICSYCLFLMVVSCLFNKVEGLKLGEKSISQVLQNDEEGTYILEILKYYSETFDSENDQIYLTKDLKITKGIEIKQTIEELSNQKRYLSLKIVDPINGQYIQSSFSKFQQIQQLFSMMLVEFMKLDDEAKRQMNSNDEISEQFTKFYQSLSQGHGFNVITKSSQNSNDARGKKLVKKILGKVKKMESVKYSVKEIVGIGFKVGIENWMSNGYSEEKFSI